MLWRLRLSAQLTPAQPGASEFVYPGLEPTDSPLPGAAELPPSKPDAAHLPPSQPVYVEIEFISPSQLGALDLPPSKPGADQ